MFGFEFRENFNFPYIALSIRDFWQRWHISLSTWIREYLYIPLGGNRRGLGRTCLNIFIVFACTGLWHGAQWTFVVWGLWHGLFRILEALGVIRAEKRFRPLSWLYTALVVAVGFVIFRADTLEQAASMIGHVHRFRFGRRSGRAGELASPTALATAAAAALACTRSGRPWRGAWPPIPGGSARGIYWNRKFPTVAASVRADAVVGHLQSLHLLPVLR
jgi:alginate O-acetyltransferase complex protein AlgI